MCPGNSEDRRVILRIIWDVFLPSKILIFILSGLRELGWAGKRTYISRASLFCLAPCASHIWTTLCCNPESVSIAGVSVAQSCLTLCDPVDCSLPGSSVHEIFQARILELVAVSYSRRSFPGIETVSPTSSALAGGFLTAEPPGKSWA